MAIETINASGPWAWRRPGVWPVAVFLAIVMIALHLMTDAIQGSEQLSRVFVPLLVAVLAGLGGLAILLVISLVKLIGRYRRQVLGSRLTGRLVLLFSLIALLPVLVVYHYSRNFLLYNIDGWFDVQLYQAMSDSLALSKAALAVNQRLLLKYSAQLLSKIGEETETNLTLSLVGLRDRAGAHELTLMTDTGQLLAFSSQDPTRLVPNLPSKEVMQHLLDGRQYTDLYPHSATELWIRVLVSDPERQLLLQALFPTSEHVSVLTAKVEDAYNNYRELAYLRDSLKFSFTMALVLVVMYSLMAALVAAFHSARRLVAPIADIAQGTKMVATLDFTAQLPLPKDDDELRVVVASFNDMIRQLARARDSAAHSQQQVETQRAYLETVLEHLSSGVIAVGADSTLRTANSAAQQILKLDINAYLGKPLQTLAAEYQRLSPLITTLQNNILTVPAHTTAGPTGREWREEVILFGTEGRQVLLCRSTPFNLVQTTHNADIKNGHVLVFDDITTLIQAQRDAAWGEVARRLAHEIKNPLTPIQLSAERLRHKCLPVVADETKAILERATHTIIQQVDAMKTMVNAFADYARPPNMQEEPIAIDTLVAEVVYLYQEDVEKGQLHVVLNAQTIKIKGDPLRLRQVLHNLIKNATEAIGMCKMGDVVGVATPTLPNNGIVHLKTMAPSESQCALKAQSLHSYVEIQVVDNGPGFSPTVMEHLFEPYVTTKNRGTGLGLAIVKKIVEEHGGIIWAENNMEGGACITMRLPSLLASTVSVK